MAPSVAWIALFLSALAAIHNNAALVKASIDIGVCYGTLGSDLPSATDVINLYKKYGIGKIRLFNPNPAAFQALRGTQISVALDITNEDLPVLAASPEVVTSWFENNIEPYLNDIVFDFIAVGNEVIPGPFSQYVLPLMKSLQDILNDKALAGIKMTTVLSGTALASSYPPSAGAFKPEAAQWLAEIVSLLSARGSPLMINVYPYFAYASDPEHIRLDYAQFTATSPVVRDGALSYYNLFDATVDAFLAAIENVGGANVYVAVAESGWPSDGNGHFTSPELAGTYNRNFLKHIVSMAGTPRRPGAYIDGYIFAMFNENQKPNGTEQHFGLFYPNMQPVYPVF